MLKIMIVDDEPLLRMAIKGLLDWEANGFKMLQDASNGKAAIELIEKEAPDILLTDIKMPGFDGVELIKYIENKHLQIKTVVLSNYDDFSFVKEALVHGAVDYILKVTITPESLINVINKLKEKFIKDKCDEKEHSKRENEIKRNFLLIKDEFLKNLVNGNISTFDEIQFNNNYYNTGLKDGKYIVCTLLADEWSGLAQKYNSEEGTVLQNTIITILNEISKFDGIFFSYNLNHYVLIIYMDGVSESSFSNNVYEVLSRFQTTIFRYTSISFTVGVSRVNGKLSDIHAAYKESILAAVYRFYMGNGKIYKYGDIAIKDEDPRAKWMSKNNIKIIKDSLERGNMEGINSILKDCFEDIEQTHNHISLVKHFFADLVIFLRSSLIELVDDYEIDMARSEKVYSQFNQCDTYLEVKNLMLEQVNIMEKSLRIGKLKKYSDIVGKAIENICADYDKSITLNSVAERINVNSSYLSRLFLKETGKNFIYYLTEIKVKKAMKFLKESNLSVQEIGEKIGYQNSKYFNRVFKKIAGISPYKYRINSKNV